VTVYLRNLNHTRRIVVRTQGAPAGRLIPPGATTALAIDLVLLADPRIQARLAQARVAVLDRGGWSPDLRERRAGQLSWPELIAAAERAEMDRLRQQQERHLKGRQYLTKEDASAASATASSVRRRGIPWAYAPRPSLHGKAAPDSVRHHDGGQRSAPLTLREIYTYADALSTRTS
jgi:hypothetical protein